jgi:LmbE family N-acetylglucosaminyl deacetylase
MSRHLVVSPHPDDAEIALGGTIHKMTCLGHDVGIAICTGGGDLTMVHSGETVSFGSRVAEQKRAAARLGVSGLQWLMLAPASKFDQVPQSEFVSTFDKLFRQYDAVYLPLPSFNDDHRRVWQAGLAAFRPGKLPKVNLYAYEQGVSNVMAEMTPGLFGRRYIEIMGTDLDAKIAAIEGHKGQLEGREDTILGAPGATTLAHMRGLEIGVNFAEMVYVVREISSI